VRGGGRALRTAPCRARGVLQRYALEAMKVLGLTGGIGCGKSTVAAQLAAYGVAVVDADKVAREVVAPGTEGLGEVVREFGRGVLDEAGALDRKALGAVVFGDAGRRAALNAILHPRIAAASAERFAALAAGGQRLALYEAALLVENRVHHGLDGLIVVTARPDVQLARVITRDGISADEARARIEAQAPLARKIAVATHVVDNSGKPARLAARVAELYAELVVLHGPPRAAARGHVRPTGT
jgi:dephospho-CoA kinase